MSKVFVPIDTAMPTRWRIVRRDTYAQAAAIFFACGVAAIAIYLISVIWPTPPPHELVLPHYGTYVPRHAVDTPIGPSWLIVGLFCVLPLPKRIATVRGLFRHGREVVGRVEKQYRKRRSTVITYTYTFEGASYHGTYPLSLGTILAFNEAVAVIVDTRRPARSVLKHAFILEEVDAVPRASVAKSGAARRNA